MTMTRISSSRDAGAAAPISAEALARVLAPFGQSSTLPGDAYIASALFAWEQEHFFDAGWMCLGRVEEISAAGDQRAVRLGRQSILLTRDASGALRGFFNVCRHRGHELLACGACANAGAVRCPYHGWAYELNGKLKAAVRFGDVPGAHLEDISLVPVRVETWYGWIFANISGQAPSLESWMGSLGRRLSAHQPERLRIAARHSYEVAANWKIITENYHECYHCPQIHPQLCRVSPPDSGDNQPRDGAWVGGAMDLATNAETMALDGKSRGTFFDGLDARQRRQVYYYGLFPSMLISLHPDYILTHRIEPLAAGRTAVECNWLFPAELVAQKDFSPNYAVEFWDMTNKQDWGACESVQRGAASPGHRQGPLSARAGVVYNFLRQVARAYRDGHFELAPADTAAA